MKCTEQSSSFCVHAVLSNEIMALNNTQFLLRELTGKKDTFGRKDYAAASA
jgi:hypothetical protein